MRKSPIQRMVKYVPCKQCAKDIDENKIFTGICILFLEKVLSLLCNTIADKLNTKITTNKITVNAWIMVLGKSLRQECLLRLGDKHLSFTGVMQHSLSYSECNISIELLSKGKLCDFNELNGLSWTSSTLTWRFVAKTLVEKAFNLLLAKFIKKTVTRRKNEFPCRL